MIPRLVLIRGAGDLATGTAHRLWKSGFKVVMLELPKPLVVRRTVSFASAVHENNIEIESVQAVLCPSPELADQYLSKQVIPVIIDPEAESIDMLKPSIVIDAIMAKNNTGTRLTDAEFVIGIGPGFTVGKDVHVIVETERGHNLGKVLYSGSAAEDTGIPAEIKGFGLERLLRAPTEGIFKPLKEIGDMVSAGDLVALVDQAEIRSSVDGLIRGMLYEGQNVKAGMKVGDIDPRGQDIDFRAISDKARAIGGGVLEAIMHRYFYNSQ